LSIFDLGDVIETLDLEVSNKERAVFQNPVRDIFHPASPRLDNLGWGVTLFGDNLPDIINFLDSPSK